MTFNPTFVVADPKVDNATPLRVTEASDGSGHGRLHVKQDQLSSEPTFVVPGYDPDQQLPLFDDSSDIEINSMFELTYEPATGKVWDIQKMSFCSAVLFKIEILINNAIIHTVMSTPWTTVVVDFPSLRITSNDVLSIKKYNKSDSAAGSIYSTIFYAMRSV